VITSAMDEKHGRAVRIAPVDIVQAQSLGKVNMRTRAGTGACGC